MKLLCGRKRCQIRRENNKHMYGQINVDLRFEEVKFVVIWNGYSPEFLS